MLCHSLFDSYCETSFNIQFRVYIYDPRKTVGFVKLYYHLATGAVERITHPQIDALRQIAIKIALDFQLHKSTGWLTGTLP